MSSEQNEWAAVEERAAARLKADEREAYEMAPTLFPDKGRPRGATGTSAPLTSPQRQALHRVRPRLLGIIAQDLGCRSDADLAAALLNEPANRGRLTEVAALANRPEILDRAREGRATATEVADVAIEVLRSAYRRWALPAQARPLSRAVVRLTGRRRLPSFTPVERPPAGLESRDPCAILLVEPFVEGATEVPATGDFDWIVRLEASRRGAHSPLYRSEVGGFLFPFASLAQALGAARAMAVELAHPRIGARFHMALHWGRLLSRMGGFPGKDLHRCESLLLLAGPGQALVSAEASGLLPEGEAARSVGVHVLPLLEIAEVFELVGPGLVSHVPESLRDLQHPFQPVWIPDFVPLPDLIDEAVDALRSRSQVVTFCGPEGAAKTQLAFHAAAIVARDFQERVGVVDLAAIVARENLDDVIAEALGVRARRAQDVVPALIVQLGSRPFLLVLNQGDWALAECRRLLERLVPACPSLRVIAASTEPLGVPGERGISLRPFSLPLAGEQVRLVDLDSSEAGRLFLTRARLAEHDAPAVAAICRLVQGHPRAIEILAAMAEEEGWEVARLGDELRTFLERQTGVPGPALPRERLLQLVIAWRLRQLASELRQVLLLLTVLPADFDAPAAAAACGMAEVRTFDGTLQRLVALGLLRLTSQGTNEQLGGVDPRVLPWPRYWLSEAVRMECEALSRFDEAHLAAVEAARDRLGRYFVDLLEDAREELEGPDQELWRRRLDQEQPNFRLTLLWAELRRKSESWAREMWPRVAAAMAVFSLQRGHTEEAEDMVEEALEAWEAADATRLRLLYQAAQIAWRRGDGERAEACWEEHWRLAETIGQEDARAHAMAVLGLAALGREAPDEARERWLASVEVARGAGAAQEEARGLFYLGLLALREGDLDEARRQLTHSLGLRERASRPNRTDIAASQLGLATLAMAEGNLGVARTCLRMALDIFHASEDRLDIASGLSLCALLALAESDPERAVRLWAAGQRVLREIGQVLPVLWEGAVSEAHESARLLLAPRVYQFAQQRGEDLDDARAVEYAMAYLN